MRPAISAGLTPIRRRAIQLAKSLFGSDTIAREIAKSTKKSKGGSGITGMVFVKEQPERTVTVKGRKVPFEVVAQILEFGRKDGSLEEKSFMRKAREEKREEALSIVTRKAEANLKKFWGRGKLKIR